jgi:hypothetical protein
VLIVQICREIGETMKVKERDETRTICHAFEERFEVWVIVITISVRRDDSLADSPVYRSSIDGPSSLRNDY